MLQLRLWQSTFALLFFLAIHPTFVWASESTPVNIVTSIKPLELLVRAVAEDSTEVTTLVPAGASPHTYTMRPSQRRALENADRIFWVGPQMESFLSRVLAGADFRQRTVSLAEDTRQARQTETTKPHEHDSDHNHDEGEDPHLWVDPAIAVRMAEKIYETLAGLEGSDKKQLTLNLQRFKKNLKQADTHIRARLKPAADISLFAYHSAFTRFAEHYNLKLEGILTLNPGLSPGARHIADVQEELRNAQGACILTEPQFNRRWWQSITRDLNVTFSTWDPLATDIAATSKGYIAFQRSIVAAVLRCLPEHPES